MLVNTDGARDPGRRRRPRRAVRRRDVAHAHAGPQGRRRACRGPWCPRTWRPTASSAATSPMSLPEEKARGHRHAGPDLPDVRDGAARRGRRGRRRAPGQVSRAVGPLRRRRRATTRTPGCARGPSADEIRTPGPTNRMIGFPYPKMMNSNNDVDQAAAIIMCSVEQGPRARHRRGPLGVPPRRAPTATSTTSVSQPLVVRTRRRRSRAAAGGRSSWPGIGIDDIEVVDLYSCFPSAVQLGAQSLGLVHRPPAHPHRRPALRRRPVEQLRDARHRHGGRRPARPARRQRGLVWANGGYVTKHAFGVYSTEPPAAGFRHDDASRPSSTPARAATLAPAGRGGRPGHRRGLHGDARPRRPRPRQAIAACLLADGRRAWGTSTDADARRRDVRRRVGGPGGHPGRRRHPARLSPTRPAPGHSGCGTPPPRCCPRGRARRRRSSSGGTRATPAARAAPRRRGRRRRRRRPAPRPGRARGRRRGSAGARRLR